MNQGSQAMVCRDSCVEFFFKPHVGSGYFNFEFSAGGSFLCTYIRDCTRTADGFVDYTWVRDEDGRKVEVWHSLPERVEPERAEPTLRFLQFRLPYSSLEALLRQAGPTCRQDLAGQLLQVWGPDQSPALGLMGARG